MVEAFLAGEVPRPIMADWCEERGIVFVRLPAGAMLRDGRRSRSGSRSWQRAGSRSTSSVETRERVGWPTTWGPATASRSGRRARTTSRSGSSRGSHRRSSSGSR